MTEAVKTVNGTMWIFTIVIIAMVVIQALLFLQLALNYNKKHLLVSKAEMNTAVRTGIITCVGTTAISPTTLALIALVGPAITYMRCGVIGAPIFEMMMADIGTSITGVEFTAPGFTVNVLILCLFCMVVGSTPYFLSCIFLLKPLDSAVERSKKATKKISFMPYLGKAAMLGLITCLTADNVYGDGFKLAAFAAAVFSGWVINAIARKTNNQTLGSFSLPIAMIIGMAAGQCLTSFAA